VPQLPHGACYSSAVARQHRTVLLRDDGAAVAFGDNQFCQCDVPQLPEGTRYVDAAVGLLHTVLLRDDGQVVAFGSNRLGQCKVPELPHGLCYISVAAGAIHSVLLRSDGQAVAFGSKRDSRCEVPRLPRGLRYICSWAGLHHTMLLRSDGRVVAFGDNADGQCDVPPLDDDGVVYVATSAECCLVITLMMRQEGAENLSGSPVSVACVSMSGEEIAVISVEPQSTVLGDVRAAVAKQLKLPPWRLRFVLSDARLLNGSHDRRRICELLGGGCLEPPSTRYHINMDLYDSLPPTPMAVTAR